jgi:hypothetical protein
VEEREVVSRSLLEAGSDGTEALQVMEEDLDAIALSVPPSIEARLLLARGVRVDDRLDFQRFQLSADRVRIVACVRYERFAAGVVRNDRFGDGRLVLLSRADFDVEGAPFRIDERVNFRGEPTSRTTQRIADDPPFPPDASW